MDPGFPPAHASLLANLIFAGRLDEVASVFEAFAMLYDPIEVKGMRAFILAHQGRKDETRKLVEELLNEPSEKSSPYSAAVICFAIGDDDKGFELLQRAFDVRDRYLGFMGIDFDLERVRGDPRYLALAEKVGLAGRIRT